jgi:hypothetical protein
MEVSPISVDPEAPNDPNVRAVLDDVLAQMKYSFAVAAAGDASTAQGQGDQVFHAFLASRKPKARAGYQQQAKAILDAPALRSAHFGRFAAIEPKVVATVSPDDLVNRVGKLQVNGAALKAALEEHGKKMEKHALAAARKDAEEAAKEAKKIADAVDQATGNALKTLSLYVTRVKAIKDTDDQWGGDDIAMGGVYVTATGHTEKVKQFEPSHDSFGSGDVAKTHRLFAKWDIETKPDGFPYVYGAVVSLAETDDGGFAEFLEKLWDHVKSIVTTAVATLTGMAIGTWIGAAFAGLGALVGAAAGLFIGWLIELFHNNDDILGAKTVRLTLAKSTMSYYKSRDLVAGSTRTLDYKGQGGHYLIDVEFKVA